MVFPRCTSMCILPDLTPVSNDRFGIRTAQAALRQLLAEGQLRLQCERRASYCIRMQQVAIKTAQFFPIRRGCYSCVSVATVIAQKQTYFRAVPQ